MTNDTPSNNATPRASVTRRIRASASRRSAENATAPTGDGNEPSRNFDGDFYRSHYPDVAHMSDQEALEHFMGMGLAEHRVGTADEMVALEESRFGALPADFDELDYLERNPDVRERWAFARAGAFHYLRFGRAEGRSHRSDLIDQHHLHLVTNRIYDLPDVEVDPLAPARINILVPAFEFKTMSAGFFGVFQVGRFIAASGYRVRLVMFDNFYWNESEFREKLRGYPGMDSLFDELEVEYIGERLKPLKISPHDNCVATVWYSAYFAQKIMDTCGDSRKFLYLIQDNEANFYPSGAMQSFAAETYEFNFNALFSTEALQNSFLKNGIGRFANSIPDHCFFNNAAASVLPEKGKFLERAETPTRRLAFYSRNTVNRNMFEMGAIALGEAVRSEVFTDSNWEFYGMGIGDTAIELHGGLRLSQLPRMNLRDYQETVSTFDIGFCLMASPHPSLLPFDLGGSAAVVVTNTFDVKNQRFFDDLCANVIARKPTVPDLVQALREAVVRVEDFPARHKSASAMSFPRSWKETWTDKHTKFIENAFRGTSKIEE